MTSSARCPSLADLLRAQAGSATATVTDFRRRVTAAELDGASNKCASALVRAGIGPGDRVALLENNSVEFLEVLFGCAKIGAVFVPLNTRLTPPEVAAIMQSCAPSLVIAHPDLMGTAESALAAASLPSERLWPLDGAAGGDPPASYASYRDAEPDAPLEGETRGDVVCLTFTSGTTGGPKGVMIRHEAFGTFLPEAARSWGLAPSSVNLVVLPMFHIGGLSWFAAGLVAGARTVLVRQVDPDAVLDICEKHGVTHTNLVATILRAMLLSQESRARDLTSFDTVTCGGAPIPAAYLRQAQHILGARFIAFYGLSEAGGGVSAHALEPEYLEGPLSHRLLSAGRPLPGIEVTIRDPGTGAELGSGQEGEVVVRSPGVMAGYWGREGETREALSDEGWLRTGDLGRIDDDRFLYLSGRLKEIIISGGENIHPAEIEDVIAAMPGVVEVCVVGVPHDVWGETPLAVVVGAPGAAPSAEEVLAWCSDRLARFKCPSAVRIVEGLPRIASGKLDRVGIRKTVLSRS